MSELNPIAGKARKLLEENRALLEIHSPSHDFASAFFPKEVLRESFEGFLENVRYRPDPRGDREARQAIAQYYRESFGCEMDPDHLILTAGTSESYAWIFRALSTGSSNRFLVPVPSYPLFDHIADFSRVGLDDYHLNPENSWELNSGDLEERIGPLTRGILLVSPHNPTGKILSRSTFKTVEEIASRKKVTLIQDEVFSEFVWGEKFSGQNFPRLEKAPFFILLNGVSKMLGLAWLKLSWIYLGGTDQNRVEVMLDKLEMISDTFLPVSGLAQKSLPHLLENRNLFLKPYRHALTENLDQSLKVLSGIPGIKVVKPESGVMLSLEVDEALARKVLSLHESAPEDLEENLVLELMEKGLYLYPGYFFDMDGDEKIRLILSFQQPPKKLEGGIKILKNFFC